MKSTFLLPLASVGFAACLAAQAGEVSIQLPVETAQLKPSAGVETAQANCMTCHSADYIQYQPPMPRKFWEAEVKKMQQKYFAPIADDKVAALADYLANAYGAPDASKK